MALVAAVNVAFAVVFGVFVVAFVALIVFIAVWAIRRDKAGRDEWLDRRDESSAP